MIVREYAIVLRRGGPRVSTFLASLIVSAQVLLVLGIALSVDTEARIRATVAAGETLVAAIEGYRRERGRLPADLELLVPKYLVALPTPKYGAPGWHYQVGSPDGGEDDVPLGMTLDRATGGIQARERQVFLLSVRLDPAQPATRFRRTASGCWRLPESPKCW